MSSENNAAATIDPPAGDEPAGAQGRGRRGSGPAKTYEFKIHLDGINVETVGEWEASNLEDSALFCQLADPDGTRMPRRPNPDDLMWIATVNATDRDTAVEEMLGATLAAPFGERAKVCKAVHDAQINLDFKALNTASGYMADVPAYWEIVATPKIGGR